MRVFTVFPGDVRPGVALAEDGTIHLGEEGRGRRLVRVPVPAGALRASRDELVLVLEVPSAGAPEGSALCVVRSHAGYRGEWRLPSDSSGRRHSWESDDAYRDRQARSTRFDRATIIGGIGAVAEGAAGAMGSGDEGFVLVAPGGSFRVHRTGRLYGAPRRWEYRNRDGAVIAVNLDDEERSAAASSSLGDLGSLLVAAGVKGGAD